MGESIQCWQCGTRMTLGELASNDGDCPRCEVEVHLAEYLDNALSKVATLEAENAKLRAELGRRAVPDGMMLLTDDQVKRHAITARECPPQSRVVLVSSLKRLASKNAAPSAPKADDPAKQMLLEALNGMLLHIREPESESEFQWPEHFKKQKAAFAAARAAIAAARKGEGE